MVSRKVRKVDWMISQRQGRWTGSSLKRHRVNWMVSKQIERADWMISQKTQKVDCTISQKTEGGLDNL